MQKWNVIPTPQQYTGTPAEGARPAERIGTFFITPRFREECAAALRFLPGLREAPEAEADLIITGDPAAVSAQDLAWFKKKNAAEQGYILRSVEDGKILIFAQSARGAAYGICTLIQLPALKPGFEVKDYPDFRYRAVKWLIWAETEIWSYDFGDGKEALLARVERMLDHCLQYKINMVFFDGWGPDPERTPQYKELMRACNAMARIRGNRLIFSAYTMGYTLSAHAFGKLFGKTYKNKRPYPDGAVYDCIGSYLISRRRNGGKPYIAGREYGTCISNDAMMEDKIAELSQFVREVRPGALYLHNIDSCRIHPQIWLARCEECRKRWPNDDLFAKDGMAGAFAYFFDRINGALQSAAAENGEDLILFNVSPGYMEYGMSDEENSLAMRFWAAVQEYAQVRENVVPLFRELYYNRNDSRRPIRDLLAGTLPRDFGVINFAGSDGFYSDQLFTLSAALTSFFKGASTVITCSGNAFCEPLAVFNAEYMWNSENSAFYRMEAPAGSDSFLPYYKKEIREGKLRPAEVFGAGGMLEVICRKLYGENADRMFRYFSLCGKGGECPVPFPCNKEMNTNANNVLLPYRWDLEISREERDGFIEKLGEILRLNREAEKLFAACANDPDLASYGKVLRATTPLAELLYRYLVLYRELERLLEAGGERAALAAGIRELADFARAHAETDLAPLDPMGGALARRRELFDTVLYNLRLMECSLQSGKRIPDEREELKDENWW